MVLYCCAFNCKEKHVKGGSYTFHSFPKDETRRKEWCRFAMEGEFRSNQYEFFKRTFAYEKPVSLPEDLVGKNCCGGKICWRYACYL
ncbi:unnamed protein product [Larinioides sclopetarius]|uniref:THAP-type domain-containing protein n=1 Tax=Larinioides sclopetarius TaxID=280406 RepID=A0AAV2AX12_9ARAC